MKALEILNNDNIFDESYVSENNYQKLISEAIEELEVLESRRCNNCKYSTKTSGGAYCMCFSMFPDFEYCSDFKPKDKE